MDEFPGLRRNRPYQALFWSQAAIEFGTQLLVVALVWAGLRQGGGSFVGILMAAWALPRGLLLVLGGVLTDRHDRRTMSILTGAGLAAVSLTLAVLTTTTDQAPAWCAGVVLLGVLDALRLPVAAGTLPQVVAPDQLAAANRWANLREWTALTAGPALGGLTVAVLGPSWAVTVAAVLYLVSALVLVPIGPLPPVGGGARTTALRDLRDGLRLVREIRELRTLLASFAVANLFVLGLAGVVVPVFAAQVLHGGPGTLGLLSASFGAGLALGTLASARLPATWQTSPRHTLLLFMVSDVFLASLAVTSKPVPASILYCLSGLAAGAASTIYRTLLQTLPPPAYLGRVSSIARALSFGLEPASTAGAGILTSRFSSSALLLAGATAAALADLAGARRAGQTTAAG